MISQSQIAAMRFGTPIFKEALSCSTTAAYGKDVFYPGDIIRLLATADMDVNICREYLFAPEMGRGYGGDPILKLWATDTEDAELANDVWRTGEMTTTSQVTLDKTAGTLSYNRVMEFGLDDQDDVVRTFLADGKGKHLAAGELGDRSFVFSINHLDSDATKLLQYQIKKHVASLTHEYWTHGGSFGTSVVWNDVTGSATEAWHNFAVTLDAVQEYSLALRPKTDYASETCHISHIGFHQACAAASANRLAQDVEYHFIAPYRCRIGADMAAGTGTLFISRMV